MGTLPYVSVVSVAEVPARMEMLRSQARGVPGLVTVQYSAYTVIGN